MELDDRSWALSVQTLAYSKVGHFHDNESIRDERALLSLVHNEYDNDDGGGNDNVAV